MVPALTEGDVRSDLQKHTASEPALQRAYSSQELKSMQYNGTCFNGRRCPQ